MPEDITKITLTNLKKYITAAIGIAETKAANTKKILT